MTDTVLAFLILVVGVLSWLHLRRLISKWKLERDHYRELDNILGALEFEKTRSVTQRFHWQRWPIVGPTLGRVISEFLYPTPRLSGAVVTPDYWRRRLYVRFTFVAPKWPRRYRRWNATTPGFFHWSTEVKGRINASAPIFDTIEERAALALGLEPRPGLFERKIDWAAHTVRVDLAKPRPEPRADVPFQEIDAS